MRFPCGRFLSSFVVALAALSLAFGCGAPSSSGPEETSRSQASGTTSGYPLTVEDSVGREVTIEEEPDRIASMAPSVTETLFAVGAGEKVVGVTTADLYPKEVTEIETVGDFQQVNIEKVLQLETDVLFVSFDSSTRERAEELEDQTNAEVVVVNPGTMEEVLASMELVGRAAGEPERGRELEQKMRSDLKEITDAVAGEPEPSVFYEVYGDPLQTVGPGSFIHDAITLAGGNNIAADTNKGYPTYSAETVIQKDPQYYLVGSLSGETPESVAERPGYAELTAVAEDRVLTVNDDLISRPGPRITDGVRQIAEKIHPEAFE